MTESPAHRLRLLCGVTASFPIRVLVLAAGLAACRGEPPGAQASESGTAPRADQVVAGVHTTLTDSLGVRKGLVQADSAFVHQADQQIVFQRVTATLYDASGDPAATVTSPRASYSAATGRLELLGGVTVMLMRGGRLTVPTLEYDARTMQFRSDSAWALEGRGASLRGTGLRAGLGLHELGRAGRP